MATTRVILDFTEDDIEEGQQPNYEDGWGSRIRHCPGFRGAKRVLPRLDYLADYALVFPECSVPLPPDVSAWIQAADWNAARPEDYPRPQPTTFAIEVPEECL